MLIYAATGKKVPPGKLPGSIGVLVINVATVKAIYDASQGIPLIHRTVTVAGGVSAPKNIDALVGTTAKDLINMCDGYKKPPKKILFGGPLMGISQSTMEVPIIKGTSAVLLIDPLDESYGPCIRCGKCVEACSMNLLPSMIAKCAQQKRYGLADHYYALDCFECGACAYVCPQKIPLVQFIRVAKTKLRK